MTHHISVSQCNRGTENQHYRVECSCGWVSESWWEAVALREAEGHLRDARPKP